MATKTYYVASGQDGNFGALVDGTTQTAATRADGWTVGKLAAAQMAEFDAGTKQATGAFSATTKPASFLTGTTANAFKTPAALSGNFGTATSWVFVFNLRATVVSAQAGRIRMRVFRSTNAAGAGATEITGATVVGTTTATLSTSTDVTSSVTWTPGSVITLNGEYLFFVIAWEVTTASGSNTSDVQIRTGSTSAISRMLTPDFIASSLDSGTVLVDLQVSTADVADRVDSATVLFDLDTSGTEFIAEEYTETDTVLIDLDASADENYERIDSATPYVQLDCSGTDDYTPGSVGTDYPDAATATVVITPSGTDLREVTDAATTPLLVSVAGVENAQLVDAVTVLVDVQTSGTDLREVTDTGTVYVDVQSSGLDTAQLVDSATTGVLLGVSGADTGQLVDATTVALDLSCSGSDVLTAMDAVTPTVVITASNLDTAQYVEAGTTAVVIGVSGTDQQTGAVVDYIDSATVLVDLTCSGVESQQFQYVDAATPTVDISCSSTEAYERFDATTVQIALYLNETRSGGAGPLGPPPLEFLLAVEAATIPVALFASGTDAISGVVSDAATVRLTLAVSAIEQQVSALQPDLLLVGTVAQRWMTQFIGLRWKTSSDILRWNGKLERQRMQPLNAVKAWKSEG